MDSEDSRRQYIFIKILTILLFIGYKINMNNIYIISSSFIVDIVKDTLFKEGYYIEKYCKGVYKVYPILYGERK